MVVFNASEKEQSTATDRYYQGIKGAKTARNVITDAQVDLSSLTLPGKGILVLELNK
jgi:hypothetical protein